jgi:hypothetical protein
LIKKMCRDFDLECELGCVIYIQDEPPILTITPDVLSELAMLQATLDFDLMILGDD